MISWRYLLFLYAFVLLGKREYDRVKPDQAPVQLQVPESVAMTTTTIPTPTTSMTNQGDAKGKIVVNFYRVEVMQEVYSPVETEDHLNPIQMKKM